MNDPICAFLDLSCKGIKNVSDGEESIVHCSSHDSEEEEEMPTEAPEASHYTLLWRHDPERTLSDWIIVLIAEDEVVEDIEDILERSIKKRKKGSMIADEIDTKSSNGNVTSIFNVHRCILANGSTYFQSQFSGQINTIEKGTSTSTIHLHKDAMKVFPIFLDYMYNPEQGRLGFRRNNAVALRHLAMYFGVDMLLKDVTDILLLVLAEDCASEKLHKEALVFHDEKLLEAIKIQNARKEYSLAIAPAIYLTISEEPEHYLDADNDHISAWKLILQNIHRDFDAFFAARNARKFPNIYVCGAGLQQVNGVYKFVGLHYLGFPMYSNGICNIQWQQGEWLLRFGYFNKEEKWCGTDLYGCQSRAHNCVVAIGHDSVPPTDGWIDLDEDGKFSPAPQFIVSLN